MRYDIAAATEDWTLLEVVKRDRHPFSDQYADAGVDELKQIFRELRLLKAAGCPPDETRGAPEVGKAGKCTIQISRTKHEKVEVFVLKAKPSGWRLYFYVKDRKRLQIEFIHAVNKKQNARDPEDLKRCCRVLEDIFGGGTKSELVYLPDR